MGNNHIMPEEGNDCDEGFLKELMELDDPDRPRPEPWKGTPRLVSHRTILMDLRQALEDVWSLHQYLVCDLEESAAHLDPLADAIKVAIALSEKVCEVQPGEDPPPAPPIPGNEPSLSGVEPIRLERR